MDNYELEINESLTLNVSVQGNEVVKAKLSVIINDQPFITSATQCLRELDKWLNDKIQLCYSEDMQVVTTHRTIDIQQAIKERKYMEDTSVTCNSALLDNFGLLRDKVS